MEVFKDWFLQHIGTNPILQGFIGGLVITFFNTIGAFLVLFVTRVSDRFLDTALGFAAGVMLTASFTSLILPGIEYGGIWAVMIGMVIGVVFLDMAGQLIPHMHFIKGKEGGATGRIKAVWLFIIAITLHNAPEGLAVGVGFGSGKPGGRLCPDARHRPAEHPRGAGGFHLLAQRRAGQAVLCQSGRGCGPGWWKSRWRCSAPGR